MIEKDATPDSAPKRTVPPLRIGDLVIDPPILQAPMAGFTNAAFRHIVRQFGGAGLLATEMVNARGFVWLDENEAEHPDRLWGVADEPRPLAVQIWDNDPETMAKVGRRLAEEYRVSVVDINFGCPVRQVTEKAHSGSYLLREPNRMHAIISRLVEVCAPTPVTAKIRLGCSRENINCNEIAHVVEEAGAAALTVHGRTAADMFRGNADWERISEIKSHLRNIPLIGNGDLDSAEKVVAAFDQYDVDAVMIARACLGRPWLFSQAAAALRGEPIPPEPTLPEQRDVMLKHYQLVVDRFGDEKGTVLMRKYACCYAQGKHGARYFRTHVAKVSTPEEFHSVVEEYFPLHDPRDEKQEAESVSSAAGS
ncbi:tRNA dihydrouridine synthase DusB [Rhodopirellula bahusiensis]|uniref:tRNA-dihydrouridine synthase n=2 Tax=Rhodopirellula bahusiensis TaxID=2014065 RepID=A0A2G1W5A6_9BACT|nr:tRNA dihydrouridine synthase DusB [Rhodopirellula bahusiensis]PHQ34181.1 tRNA dihydrouridine synthase DusB [Rhodopirellula bahusiensis]